MDATQGTTDPTTAVSKRFECRVVSAASALSLISEWPDQARVLLVRTRESDPSQQDANAALARLLIRFARPESPTDEDSGMTLSLSAGLEVRPAQQTVTFQRRPVTLTASEFSLLVELLKHREHVRSPGQLAEAIWGYQQVGNPNFVQAHVSRMRKKLAGAGCPDVITTVRSRGYVIRDLERPPSSRQEAMADPQPRESSMRSISTTARQRLSAA